MFSHNKKISARQMKSLLIMDWLAKLCLLLPIFLTGRSLGTMVGCLAIGLLAWLWFSVLLARAAKEQEDFFDTVSRLGGRGSAWLVYLIGLLYFLSHTAVCMSFCADLAQTYMLPEVPLPALVILPLIAGLYLAYSGIEVRGRVSEFLVPILLFFFLFMTAAAVPGMNLPENGQTLLKADRRLFAGGYEVFAAVGGMFLPVLAVYLPDKERDFGRGIRRAACWSVIPAGILLFITAGSFGTEGMLAFRFPGIRVMSNVAVPGGFIQRWDILFLSLLLFSLAVSVASGFWYLNTIAERLWSEAASYLMAYREYRERAGLEIWAGTRITRKKPGRGFRIGTGISGRRTGTEPAMPGQPAIVSAAIENANGLALYKWQQELAEEIGVGDVEKPEFWEEQDQDTDETGTAEFPEEKEQNTNGAGQAGFWEQRNTMASFRGLFILQGVLAFIVFCAAGGFRSAESAIIYYRAYNLYVLTPAMFVVYLMLYFRRKQDVEKHRAVKTAALCLILCFLLTGCTARELEDRMFPMALEIRVDDGIPTMIYAWNGERDSGSGGGGRSREPESESEPEQKSGDESESETEQGLGSGSEQKSGDESESEMEQGFESGLEQKSGNRSENEMERGLGSEPEQKYEDESGNGTRQEEGKAEQETEFEKGAESGTKQETGKRTGSESGSETGERTETKSEKRTESKSSNRTETESGEYTGKESDHKTEEGSETDTEMEEGNEAWKESVAEEEESGSRSEYESGDSTQSCFGSGNTDSTENAEEAAGIDYEPQEEGNLTIFRADNLAKIQKQVEEYGDRYIDYSHVKAIIWDEKLEQYPALEQEIYEWLAAEPAFAANLIIYPARESGLTLEEVDERSDGEIGVYLENLYRNNKRLRESAVTLGKMTARYYDLHEDKAGKSD